jgi:hypothetical protein
MIGYVNGSLEEMSLFPRQVKSLDKLASVHKKVCL